MTLPVITANLLIFVTVRSITKSKDNYEVQKCKAIMEIKGTFEKRIPYMQN